MCGLKNITVTIYPGFVEVLENLESPGILLWHFPGMKSPGKRQGPEKFWKSVKLE